MVGGGTRRGCLVGGWGIIPLLSCSNRDGGSSGGRGGGDGCGDRGGSISDGGGGVGWGRRVCLRRLSATICHDEWLDRVYGRGLWFRNP